MSKITRQELKSRFLKKLSTSALTEKDAGLLKLKPFMADEAKTLKVPAFAGFKIPYFDERGRLTDFYRVRFLEPTKKGFAKMTKEKDLRYAQPAATTNEIYLPPFINWFEYFKGDKPLVITEGELKAACATRKGIPTMGLGGVWNFRAAKQGMGLLPIFQHMNLKDRPIYVVYDSDALRNQQVIMAENALCRELTSLGGKLYIGRLPDITPEGKTGLDDYLLVKKPEDLHAEVLATAHPYTMSEELHKLNEEIVFVRDPSMILEYATGQRIAPRVFTESLYVNRTYKQIVATETGTKLKEVCAAKEWLKWAGRAEVKKLVYAPGEPAIYSGALNTWRGWAVEPVAGDIGPWKKLLDYMFQAESPEYRKWFEQWCAYPLQHPGTKMFSACVFWGTTTGTGKTLIGYTLMKIYGDNAIEISNEDLESGSNDYAENKQFAVGEEITGGDKRGLADRLKSLITRRTVRINVKYIPKYTAEDRINYYFTSNHPDAFFLDDSDRRYFVQEINFPPLPDTFYKAYDAWYSGDGIKHLFHYLLNLDLTGFEPHGHAPMTAGKRSMIDSGRSELNAWARNLKNDPDTVLRIDSVVIPHDLWRTEDLLALFDSEGRKRVGVPGMGRELKRVGLVKLNRDMGCYTSKGQYKLWAVRNAAKYEGMGGAELGKLYDKEREVTTKRRKF